MRHNRILLEYEYCFVFLFARSLEGALHLSRLDEITVVVYDRDLPGVEWRKGLEWLIAAAPVVFILLSSIIDQRL